jgi:hypothetical protein
MAPRLFRARRIVAVGGLALGLAFPILAVGGRAADAALPPNPGCGFHLGPLNVQGALGTLYFMNVLEPNSVAQDCTVAINVSAQIRSQGAPYFNIDNNPFSATETVSFLPGRLPPSVGMSWSRFHCADPASPGSLTLSIGGHQEVTGVDANSCGPPGTSHSLLAPFVFPLDSEVGIARTADDRGYRSVDQAGFITAKGDATSFGATAFTRAPGVAIVSAGTGGVWVAASDGGVFSYGTARFHGSLGNVHLNAPVVGMAATPDEGGYWLVAADGGVFSFGDARFHGSLGHVHLNAPVVGMAATPGGGGYWLVAADGGVFNFGDAHFSGSLGNLVLRAQIVGMAAGPHTGYWLVASDGGVFTFGGVPFEGSTGGVALNAPISGMAATSTGHGYWLVGADNGIFTFGDAGFFGSNPQSP